MNESQTERSTTLRRVPGGPSGSARARSNGRVRFCPAIPVRPRSDLTVAVGERFDHSSSEWSAA